MARPAPPFVTLKDEVRAELRSVADHGAAARPTMAATTRGRTTTMTTRTATCPIAVGRADAGHRSQVFGSRLRRTRSRATRSAAPEDEITSDFQIPRVRRRERPRARAPPTPPQRGARDRRHAPWQPLDR